MAWLTIESLFSIARRLRLDPRIKVFIEEEDLNPRPRNPEKPFRESLESEDNGGEKEDEY